MADAAATAYLDALVARARSVLGAELVGAYAAGSLALDAYQPGRSDIDVALVAAASLDDTTKRDLVAALRHEALPVPARGLELVVYAREVARAGTTAPGFEVELNTGPAMAFRVTYRPEDRPPADGLFWYALDRSILHVSCAALVGPPAADVFADVTRDDLRTLLTAALTWWLARPATSLDGPSPGSEDAVLGACRSLVRYREGTWLPKVAAGRRLVEQGHPAATMVEQAIGARLGDGPAPSGAEAQAVQRAVLDEIQEGRP